MKVLRSLMAASVAALSALASGVLMAHADPTPTGRDLPPEVNSWLLRRRQSLDGGGE